VDKEDAAQELDGLTRVELCASTVYRPTGENEVPIADREDKHQCVGGRKLDGQRAKGTSGVIVGLGGNGATEVGGGADEGFETASDREMIQCRRVAE
jgi:hypothetical protein